MLIFIWDSFQWVIERSEGHVSMNYYKGMGYWWEEHKVISGQIYWWQRYSAFNVAAWWVRMGSSSFFFGWNMNQKIVHYKWIGNAHLPLVECKGKDSETWGEWNVRVDSSFWIYPHWKVWKKHLSPLLWGEMWHIWKALWALFVDET